MLKKSITYTDYEGVERTEDFYFNLSKAELVEMEFGVDGGLQKKIEKIVQSRDSKEIISMFKDIILRSYGVKSDDGKRFIKSKELADQFSQTEAYSELFIKLASDDKEAAEFINGIVPSQLAKEIENVAANPVGLEVINNKPE